MSRLVGEDIFNGNKPLNLDKLFDSEGQYNLDEMDEDKHHEMIN